MAGIGHNQPPEDLPDSGWVKLWRDARSHPVVGFQKPLSRFEAWQDTICEAGYKPSRRNIAGATIAIDAGQLIASRAYLAERWGWSEKQVRTFVDRLVAEGMLKKGQPSGQQKGASKQSSPSILTVCNYTKYQALEAEIKAYVDSIARPTEGPAKGQPGASQGPESKKERRKEEKVSMSKFDSDRSSGKAAVADALDLEPDTIQGIPEKFKDWVAKRFGLMNGSRDKAIQDAVAASSRQPGEVGYLDDVRSRLIVANDPYIAAWNSAAASFGLRKVQAVKASRLKVLDAIAKSYTAEEFSRALRSLGKSDFAWMIGRGKEKWKVHFDFFGQGNGSKRLDELFDAADAGGSFVQQGKPSVDDDDAVLDRLLRERQALEAERFGHVKRL